MSDDRAHKMSKDAQALLRVLMREDARRGHDDSPRFRRAADLAEEAAICPDGNREARRRAVRKAREELNDNYYWTISTLAGIALARSHDDHEHAANVRRARGVAEMQAAREQQISQAARQAKDEFVGQGCLFGGGDGGSASGGQTGRVTTVI